MKQLGWCCQAFDGGRARAGACVRVCVYYAERVLVMKEVDSSARSRARVNEAHRVMSMPRAGSGLGYTARPSM